VPVLEWAIGARLCWFMRASSLPVDTGVRKIGAQKENREAYGWNKPAEGGRVEKGQVWSSPGNGVVRTCLRRRQGGSSCRRKRKKKIGRTTKTCYLGSSVSCDLQKTNTTVGGKDGHTIQMLRERKRSTARGGKKQKNRLVRVRQQHHDRRQWRSSQ